MSRSTTEHEGRVAVVTGSSSGIGLAIASRLAAEGVHVFGLDRTSPPREQAAEVRSIPCDVASEADVARAFATVEERAGRLDYLVCCAAVFPAVAFADLSNEAFGMTLSVNLTGSFLCCRAAVRLMLPARSGRIVLFSSMQARSPAGHSANYAASKGGILGLARSLALEMAPNGIRVNTVSPGLTDTPQPRGHLTEAELAARAARIPLGRLGRPEDAADACLFLLGDESAFITGQDLRVNGGAPLW